MAALLAQLSDPHVNLADGSGDALAAAVEAVLALDPPPDAVLVTGDVADGAFADEYELAAELLARLPMPVHAVPGNHDDVAALRERFDVESFTVGELRVVACDTAVPGLVTGRLDTERLDAELTGDAPAIVAMHHPPFDTGIPALDEIGLPDDDRRRLAELLPRRRNALRVISGHVHRGAFGTVGGRGVLTCPSTHLNAKLEIGAPEYTIVREPAAFLLHAYVGGELISHVQPV